MATLAEVWHIAAFNDELRRRCESAMWIHAANIMVAQPGGMTGANEIRWARACMFDTGPMATSMVRSVAGDNATLSDIQIRSLVDNVIFDSIGSIYPGFANGDD